MKKGQIRAVAFLLGIFLPVAALEGQERVPRAVPLGQYRLAVEHGEYSGICHLEEDLYAVVDDNDPGGGIHLFYLPLGRNGRPGAVSQYAVDANLAGPSGRDNEDIVYLPSLKTFFVSSEAEASIREYDLAGRPTGRQMAVPEEWRNTPFNRGVEAIASDGSSVWAITEMPMIGDAPLRHRLIRYCVETLSPAGLSVYECDAPEKGPEGTRAYVHGISAMTALPDGRLIVLEREVFVPDGSPIQMLGKSFTRASLYLTDPLNDPTLPLRKTLLARVETKAANLANFEGMCLGRPLPDGRPTLLLIPDSERGMHGLVGEYLYVMALEGL